VAVVETNLSQQVDIARRIVCQCDQLVRIEDSSGVQMLGYAVLDKTAQLIRMQRHPADA
jgi:hypothetical protein